eukprot:m.137086 g.137086  ORF g.137086 m.137086 type:complete len:59 (-) comp52490_c0_seq6:74-250(-)
MRACGAQHSSKHSGEEAFSAQLVRECLLATQSLFDDAEKHLWLKEDAESEALSKADDS